MLSLVFETRSYQLERMDTGDYTSAEYERCISELSFINRFLGDVFALKKTLLREIEKENLQNFSVLDVGAGSGEILRTIAKFGRKQKRKPNLCGLELNARSSRAILEESKNYVEISAVRGNALGLPFADNAFDYAICTLFTHHFMDQSVVEILREMARVSKRKIFVVDLHRHKTAYSLYKIFCAAFGISDFVRGDGSLSILRAFKSDELEKLAAEANLPEIKVERHFPFRLVLQANANRSK
ncbi:MAG TPA: methyltransferase domain-containing protein [Pyrinomonadaceae bacterium]|nr:methyltransferase domain-containing protein [Pyrinomonadaceae bacterium]